MVPSSAPRAASIPLIMAGRREGAVPVCASCGCLAITDDHSPEEGHITLSRLQRAADAAGLPLAEAAWNIPRTLAAATQPHTPDGGMDPLTGHPTLVWDVDGVLAFTAEGLCCALNARFGTGYDPVSQGFFPGHLDRLPPGQARFAHGLFTEGPFLAALAPDFRALDCLRDATDAGYACVVCTERDPAMADVTAGWLSAWGASDVDLWVLGRGGKPGWVAQQGFGPDAAAVLLDDSPVVAMTVPGPGVQVWAPQRPGSAQHLRAGELRFGSWAQVRGWLGLGPNAT